MRVLDRWLQRWRIGKAEPWIRRGDRLLDVGCFDQTLIRRIEDRVAEAVGIDRKLEPSQEGRIRFLRGDFPDDFALPAESFDCITMLAVLEHVPRPEVVAQAAHRLLAPGGRVVLTVPHPAVDRLVDLLQRLRLLDGMAAEEHHGFDVSSTVDIFAAAGFRLVARRRFQLGLNHLFVFERSAA